MDVDVEVFVMKFFTCVVQGVDQLVDPGAVHLRNVCCEWLVVGAFDSVGLPVRLAGAMEMGVGCREPVLAVVTDEFERAVVVCAGGDAGVGDEERHKQVVFVVESFKAVHVGMAGQEADNIGLVAVDGVEEAVLDGGTIDGYSCGPEASVFVGVLARRDVHGDEGLFVVGAGLAELLAEPGDLLPALGVVVLRMVVPCIQDGIEDDDAEFCFAAEGISGVAAERFVEGGRDRCYCALIILYCKLFRFLS